LLRYLEPARISPIHLAGRQLRDPVVLQVGAFIFAYATTWAAGSLLLALLGCDLATACSAALSCLSNIGPGIGTIGPAENWAGLSDAAKLVCIVLMLLGRLELFGVLLMARAGTWRR
jgi:trk system potassium uptake protein TrkH